VVVLLLAQDPPATDASQGPVVLIVLGVIGLLGTVATAGGPVLLEMAKSKGLRLKPSSPAATAVPVPVPAGPSPPSNPAPALADQPPAEKSVAVREGAQQGLSMIEAAVLDYRQQRDRALDSVDRKDAELDEAHDIIREQAVYIAQLEERLGMFPRNGGRHGRGAPPPQSWKPR
jgi:hypothetical protein